MSSAPVRRLLALPVGTRVVVRHLIEDGDRATDVLGELVGIDGRQCVVRTRGGPVSVDLATVVAAKPVPPPPPRRPSRRPPPVA